MLLHTGLLLGSLAGLSLASSAGYIEMELESSMGTKSPLDRYQKHIERRDGSFEVDLTNMASYYQVKVSIGTPSQDILLTVDTGSSDLWVLSSQSDECEKGLCPMGASFDESKSSSFKGDTSNMFGIQYGDGTSAKGYWAQDSLTLNGQTIHNGNFALATSTSSNLPVFGIGLTAGETAKTKYDNVPVQLKQQGLIKTMAYSLWLNDIEAKKGSLLFGGVDHSKYTGQLQKVPMVNDGQINPGGDASDATSLSIMLHKISVYSPDNMEADVVSTSMAVLLDSGTTLSYLPTDLVKAVGQAANATWSNSLNMNLLPCDVEGGMTFDFSGIRISVPFRQMLMNIKSSDGSEVTLDNGKEACALGVQGWTRSQYILGDTLLRGCYTVFDLDNKEVALAPINYSPSSPNVEAIDGQIPSASQAPSYSSTSTGTAFSTLQLKFTAMPSSEVAQAEPTVSSAMSSAVSSFSSSATTLSSVSSSVSSSAPTSGSSSNLSSASSGFSSSAESSSIGSSASFNVSASSFANSTSAAASTTVTTSSAKSTTSTHTSSSATATRAAETSQKKKNTATLIPVPLGLGAIMFLTILTL